MNKRMSAALIAAVSVWPLAAFAQSHPPAEAFGSLPVMSDPRLSPDGQHLAVVQSVDGIPAAVIYRVNAPAGTKAVPIPSGKWIIDGVRWAKNDRLLLIVKQNTTARMTTGCERGCARHL
jgi:hypothetical protein